LPPSDQKKDAWNKFWLVVFFALAGGVIAGISTWLSSFI